jgi:hypothetical protein
VTSLSCLGKDCGRQLQPKLLPNDLPQLESKPLLGVRLNILTTLVDSGLLPGSFAVPAAGRYGKAIRIPLSTVLKAEEKWTVGRHDGHAALLQRRNRRGNQPGLEHFPELSAERDGGCREGDLR